MSFTYQTEEPAEDTSPAENVAAQPRVPIPVYTIILIASFGVVAVVQMLTGLERSILLAGFVKQDFLRNHQYWRILTGAAMHGGVLHVGVAVEHILVRISSACLCVLQLWQDI